MKTIAFLTLICVAASLHAEDSAPGSNATFSVSAAGTTPVSYQWSMQTNDSRSPREWIDPDTGHRVVQLSTEPGSQSLYFNLNPFTPDGKRMVFTTPTSISMLNLETHAVERIVEGPRLHIIMVGHKTGKIYYLKVEMTATATNRYVCATDPGTKATETLLKLGRGQNVATVNADETLLAGTITEREHWSTNDFFETETNHGNDVQSADAYRNQKGHMMERRLAARYPMELFTYNLESKKIKKFNRCTDWLNHLQFSPTDPTLLMFCHEGDWHKVNRIWTIRTDGSHLTLIHKRTMAMEIAGHEFWSADGRTIWYDLQTPRGEDFWVAGDNVYSGARTWYHLQRNEWGVHFNVSPDGKLFCSDGGDEHMVAHAPDGKWLYLFRPELLPDLSGPEIDSSKLIHPGVFHSEKLVNMSRHDYALEPNLMFTPDMKWLIFRSNMSGANQVYAVELKRADGKDESGDKIKTSFY
ncbi:MAG TPA: oligogalacturonate lyase family protein [Verrucomicrobiae bacterium]|nr:oligogalacturonate lyase family protein [Verrucomicrobiae bacterium]